MSICWSRCVCESVGRGIPSCVDFRQSQLYVQRQVHEAWFSLLQPWMHSIAIWDRLDLIQLLCGSNRRTLTGCLHEDNYSRWKIVSVIALMKCGWNGNEKLDFSSLHWVRRCGSHISWRLFPLLCSFTAVGREDPYTCINLASGTRWSEGALKLPSIEFLRKWGNLDESRCHSAKLQDSHAKNGKCSQEEGLEWEFHLWEIISRQKSTVITRV